jgi:hypothetical protein
VPRSWHLDAKAAYPAPVITLAEGRDRWSRYLDRIRMAGLQPDVLLEFLPGDNPDLLASEAATLRELINS